MEYQHSATLNELMDPGNDHQWLLTLQEDKSKHYVPPDGSSEAYHTPPRKQSPPSPDQDCIISDHVSGSNCQFTGKTGSEEHVNTTEMHSEKSRCKKTL